MQNIAPDSESAFKSTNIDIEDTIVGNKSRKVDSV